MPGAVLYIRVSTAAQEAQIYNLPTQTRKVEDRCKHDGLPILKTFIDADSARTTDRPQFQEMLTYCREHRGKVTHVVFADLSRLARNIEDQASTLATFKQLDITPVSCDERIEDSAAGRMAVNMLGVVNQFYSDSLSERIRYRMAAGVQEGRWLWLAPIGYLNGTNGTSGLQVDPQRAPLVRQAFEWVATRSYSLEEILRRLRLLGLTTRRAGRIAKGHWAQRLDRIKNERRRLSTINADAKTLNQKILLQKVNGELSAEDFITLKETMGQQRADTETQMAALDAESLSMEALLQESQNNIIDLVGAWKTGGVQQRQELASNLFPEGLRFSQETLFFEPGNVLLMNIMHEMVKDLAAGKNIGAGDGD
jgi:DNA invertase Pin-like site-specific DNA recombinase